MMEANLTEQAKERQLDSMEIYPVLAVMAAVFKRK